MKRKTRKQKPHDSPSEVSYETIKIERNLIQKWLLDLRSWARQNIKALKVSFLIFILALIISLILVGLYTALTEKQNYQFFSYLTRYNKYKLLEDFQEKNDKFRSLIQDSRKLCDTSFKTSHSYNACLLEAASYIELKEYKKASKPLNMFGQHNADNGAGLFALFFAAQAYENLLNFEEAYNIYNQIESPLRLIGKEDIAIYNKGKILYIQGKLDLAEKMFQEVANDKKASKLEEASRRFLRLIAFKKNKQLDQRSKINSKPD